MQPEKRRIRFQVYEQPEPVPASPKIADEDKARLADLAIRSFEPEIEARIKELK